MAKLVFHVDVNSAYLSWEAARRVANGEPDIRLIPSVIGGDREKRTGVVLAKSIPAKKFGIKTGEPIGMALRKCPDLFMAKPDFRLYEENSKKFMDICREYAPVVEKASIDECYLDMSGTHRIYPDPIALAYTIKDRIRDEFGFTVNVGIGDNKLLAKMASDFEKPDKVHTMFLHEMPQKMWPLPVGDLFTVGGATADKLRQAKIMTIGDLAHADLARVQKVVGLKMGKHIHDYANGIDPSPVLAEPEEAKGYSISTTLEEDVKKAAQAYPVLLALADSVTARRAGEISTQYSNLHVDPDEKFYIPENVYIIGTMNDIDRSVDSFDFAMRRRFRFVELRADERLEMLALLENEELEAEAIRRMAALNKEIAAVEDLNENYQIGASYFLKLKTLDFDQLWTDYLQPLLQEYIHGMYDEEGIMNRFAKAYGYQSSSRGDLNEAAQDQG